MVSIKKEIDNDTQENEPILNDTKIQSEDSTEMITIKVVII